VNLIRVAVPVPSLDLLTYAVPDGMQTPAVGARVLAPLATRVVAGLVVETGVTAGLAAAQREIKPIRQLLDADAFVPADIVELARWTAEYYAAGAGETITSVLPPKTRGQRADAHKSVRVAAITVGGLHFLGQAGQAGRAGQAGQAGPAGRALTARQLEVLEMLSGAPHGLPTSALAARGVEADMLARLARRGLVSLRRERVDRDPFDAAVLPTGRLDAAEPAAGGRRLTLEQSEALARLQAMVDARRFRVALLHGVTGSGKSEVYLRLASAVRAAGRTALILVPEIALTPAVAALFRDSFGERVAIQHSGLSDGERHDQWQRIRRGAVDVVVGTRSAVFAPLSGVGLVVVDEEHDSSYKQEESPRYNARDVAIVRARGAAALVVLGSATPSMESYHNAVNGRYERIVLERRVLDRPLASVTVVDMREEYAALGPDVVLSRPLQAAIGERLTRGEQVLVLLNRRGFATSVFCRQCAGTLDCPNCSISLVVHGEGAARRARCHYCNYTARVPGVCPLCAAPYLEQAGFGTERVESEVKRLFPAARVARMDRDAVRRKGALTGLLSRFAGRDVDILVGTQMIAKGHDFPRVTLVGVVSADVGLGMADFRAAERTFQLLTQVAGRAGRGERAGQAIIQTVYPDHYSIQLACRQDYPAFYERELRFRREMRYPPQTSLINAVVRSRTFAGAMDDAADLVQRMRESDERRRRDVAVLGPAPAPLARLRGEYRVQLLVKGTNRRRMREALQTAIAARPELARRITIDVDPVSVL
jgi:primosomal protein N' (replication factor Y)